MTRNRKPFLIGLLGAAAVGLSTLTAMNTAAPTAQAAATPGQPAPAFSVQDTTGKTRTLAEFAGKYVVLEWINHQCPFVKKHYNSDNMQKTQRAARTQGAVWLSVNSSAAGKQGHTNAEQADNLTLEKKAEPSAVLLDTDGTMGRAYGAKTTPHMFIIDPKGNVIYNGAIDDKASADASDVAGARNHVLAALEQVKKGEAVTVAASQPYGCSVKY